VGARADRAGRHDAVGRTASCAVLASRCDQLEDPHGIRIGAEALEGRVRQVLVRVRTGQVSASEYRLM
jgi:hypothetical protein